MKARESTMTYEEKMNWGRKAIKKYNIASKKADDIEMAIYWAAECEGIKLDYTDVYAIYSEALAM
jgi:hypothetical protein